MFEDPRISILSLQFHEMTKISYYLPFALAKILSSDPSLCLSSVNVPRGRD